MRVRWSVLCLVCCGVLAWAAEGNLLRNADFGEGLRHWGLGGPKEAREAGLTSRTEAGTLEVTVPDFDHSAGVVLLTQSLMLPDARTYVLEYDIEVERPGTMRHLYQYSVAPWASLGTASNMAVTPGRRHHVREVFTTSVDEPEKPRHLTFNLTRLSGKVRLSNIVLREHTVYPAAQLPRSWTVFRGVRLEGAPPAEIPRALPAETGRGEVAGDVRELDATGTIWLEKGGRHMPERRVAVLYNVFECEREGMVRLGLAADWWLEVFCNGERVWDNLATGNVSKQFSFNDHEVEVPVRAGRNVLAVKVLSGSAGWRFVCGVPTPPLVFRANDDWLPVDVSRTHVQAGSALDMSALVEAPAGRHGRLTLNGRGELVFEGQPDRPVRLQGFNGMGEFRLQDEEAFRAAVRRLAETARRQGYSLFRTNGVLDRTLMRGAKADMAINPAMLDRWDYVLSEFKKQGIYIHLVMLSYQLYDTVGAYPHHFEVRNGHRLMLYFGNEWERQHFRYACETLLNHVNPYTGLAWKDDPAIAFLEFYNEQCSGFGNLVANAKSIPGGWELVQRRWREWLVAKYGDRVPEALRPELDGKPLSEAPVPPYWRDRDTPLANEFGLFRVYIAKDGAEWCERLVRGLGYRGLTTNYNAFKRFADQCARWQTIQVIDHHSYYQHPRGGWGAPGCTVEQNSSLDDALGVWRGVAAMRFAGRPLIVSEFNYSYWNPYQHEGMLFPAYSAFQNFASLQIHSDISFEFTGKASPLHTFGVGNSPVIRANEFFSNCLFLRGDVTPAPHLVEYVVPEAQLGQRGMTHVTMDGRQSRVSLLTGLAMAFPWAPLAPRTVRGPRADVQMLPDGTADVEEADWFFNVLENPNGTFDLAAFVASLRQRGILPRDNATDPANEVFQSETGELTLRAKERVAKVVTARSEAATLPEGHRETLGRLTVENSSVHATVGLCSVSGEPVADASRLVLVYATRCVNSHTVFSHDGRRKIAEGRLPVLQRRGHLRARFRPASEPGRYALYALDLQGVRQERVPVSVDGDELVIDLDTGRLKRGPATFFELVRD